MLVDDVKTWKELTPDERVELYKEAWAPGRSASDIAEVLSYQMRCPISRNSVISIYHRNRKALAQYPLRSPKQAAASKRKEAMAASQRPRPLRAKKPAPLVTQTDPVPLKGAEVGLHVTLLELTQHSCRYPTKFDGGQRFCGIEAGGSEVWCAYHRSIVYAGRVALNKEEQRAMRLALRAALSSQAQTTGGVE